MRVRKEGICQEIKETSVPHFPVVMSLKSKQFTQETKNIPPKKDNRYQLLYKEILCSHPCHMSDYWSHCFQFLFLKFSNSLVIALCSHHWTQSAISPLIYLDSSSSLRLINTSHLFVCYFWPTLKSFCILNVGPGEWEISTKPAHYGETRRVGAGRIDYPSRKKHGVLALLKSSVWGVWGEPRVRSAHVHSLERESPQIQLRRQQTTPGSIPKTLRQDVETHENEICSPQRPQQEVLRRRLGKIATKGWDHADGLGLETTGINWAS